MVVRLYFGGSPNWAPAFAGVVGSRRSGGIMPGGEYYAVSVASFAFA